MTNIMYFLCPALAGFIIAMLMCIYYLTREIKYLWREYNNIIKRFNDYAENAYKQKNIDINTIEEKMNEIYALKKELDYISAAAPNLVKELINCGKQEKQNGKSS